MSPFNFVLRSAASGLRQTGRVMQFVGDRLGELGGVAQAQAEEETAPSQEPSGVERARPGSTAEPKPLNDVAITRKVETEIFRDPNVPKGQIDVNTAGGVVWLRGEAKTPEMINDLERLASEVPEVERVENLLHLPKTPAPSRADTPRRQQKTRRSKPAQTQRRATTQKSVEQEAPESAEPTPKEVAGKGEGRQPAPLGTEEAGEE
ncbi:MAG TPA: BON domain-containing protein [Thermoleophilaceae bacterium]|nr:BON domain-containing protein [Thermoleophilaceae bacterium]